jgi:hypothetical protein
LNRQLFSRSAIPTSATLIVWRKVSPAIGGVAAKAVDPSTVVVDVPAVYRQSIPI